MKSDIKSIPAIYKTLNRIFSFGILFDKNEEITVTQIEIKSQNNAVKSLALKLFSTMLPASSVTGQPHPSYSTIKCWLSRL